MFSEKLNEKILRILKAKISDTIRLESHQPESGGDINEAFKLKTTEGDFFIKTNDASRFPKMFEKEAKGLQLLWESGEINVPKVIAFDEADNTAFLVLAIIESAQMKTGFWDDFGRSLARMHKHGHDYFGLDHDNFIGSLFQSNKKHTDWISFFIEERLEAQIKMARDNGLISRETIRKFEKLFHKLSEIFPVEPPALLHGDLWNGNYLIGNDGKACLIDPAVYYGHREMDLGMSKLFGGFNTEFYESYHDEYPLEKGWQNRVDICNLYPLMVHVNLFGGSYVYSVDGILKRF